LDARAVVSLCDHLRADEHGAIGTREPLQRVAQLLRLLDRIRVEADPLELRHPLRELALELLRSRSDPRELGRAARGARLPHRLDAAAVVAAERAVAVKRQRDVAVGAAAGGAAGPPATRRRGPAA